MANVHFSEASVHGRFQPFHNGHLEYVLAATERCDFLWIGITKYDIDEGQLNPLGREREKAENNPLTYFERRSIISRAMLDVGKRPDAFAFVPFPIEQPRKLPQFIPVSVPCLTTIYENWNREKVTVLVEHGYSVEVLYERPESEKKFRGHAIREDIMAGGRLWQKMVPAATREFIEKYDIANRLRRLRAHGHEV